MRGVWIFFIANIINFSPLYFNFYIVIIKNKICYSIAIYGCTVVGGYITRKKFKIFIHINKHKALLFDVYDFLKNKKGFFSIKGIMVGDITTTTIIGTEHFFLCELAILYNMFRVFGNVFTRSFYRKIKNNLWMVEGDKNGMSAIKVQIIVNLYTIINILLKNIVNKAGYKWKKIIRQ